MKKINREFEERCLKLKNRIQKLKIEEEDYRKKMRNHIKREEQDKQIKNEKERLKLELQRNRDEQNKALTNKRNLVKLKKEKDIKNRLDKKNANLSQKKSNYKNFLTDKYVNKILKEQLSTLQKHKNAYSHAKVKQEYNEYETNKIKKNIQRENLLKKQHENNINQLKGLEKELRKTCNKLEIIEKEYIDKLNKTKYQSMKILENSKSFNYSSLVAKNRSKLFINKSMENIDINGAVNNDNEDNGDYKNRNRSVIVKKNKLLSPTSKSQKNMIIFKKPKTKNKLISINYYPNTNRVKGANKIVYNNNPSTSNNKEKGNIKIKKNFFKEINKN